jgi:hypothetical protein
MPALEELIPQQMQALQLDRMTLVARLGYRNIRKGARRLDEWLNGEAVPVALVSKLAAALELPATSIAEAIATSEQVRREERKATMRANFFPHLFVVTEQSLPTQITLSAIGGFPRERYLALPGDFMHWPASRQEALIQRLIRECVARYQGVIPTFGAIQHFVCCLAFDEPPASRTVYTLQGEPMAHPLEADQAVTWGAGYAQIGRQRIDGIFHAHRHA